MTQTCHPITQAVAQDMLRGLVEAICDRPAQTKAQRDSRSTEVVHSVLAFEPRDPVEMMLAGLVVTHFHLISHAAHEAFGEQPEDVRPRARSGIVALDRAMVGFVKELRTAKTRPMEGAEEVARSDAPAAQAARATPEREAEASPSAAVVTANTAVSWRDGAPEPLLSPLRRGAASGAAMLAVVSPPVTTVVGNGARKEAAVSRASSGPDAPAAPDVGTDAKEDRLARLAKMLEVPTSTAGVFRVAGADAVRTSVAGAR
jgi:hypothetical protein